MSRVTGDFFKELELVNREYFTGLSFCPLAKRLAVQVGDGSLQIIDIHTEQVKSYPKIGFEHTFQCKFTADGKHVVSGGGGNTLVIRDVDDDAPQRAATFQTAMYVNRTIPNERALPRLPKHILACILKYNSQAREPRVMHVGSVQCFAISRDCKTIVTADTTLKVWKWDFASGERTGVAVEAVDPTALAIIDDAANKILVGSKNVMLFEQSRVYPRGLDLKTRYNTDCDTRGRSNLAVTSDCRKFVCADKSGAVNIWDIESGTCLGKIAEAYKVSFLQIVSNDSAVVIGDMSNVRVNDMDPSRFESRHIRLSSIKNTFGDARQIGNVTYVAFQRLYSPLASPGLITLPLAKILICTLKGSPRWVHFNL